MKRCHGRTPGALVLGAMAAWGGSTGGALAQAAAAGEPATATLPAVTVTTQRREQTLLEIPSAVQGFTRDDIESAGVRDLGDLIRSVPGASQGRSTQTGTRSFQLRGVTSFYGDSTIGYYLDDAIFTILNRNWAPVGRTFDVNRVEVPRNWDACLAR